MLRRIASTMIAYGLYMVTPFCPTRLNCADDPTRERPLREPVHGLDWTNLPLQHIWSIAQIKCSRRWASNWIRLTLLIWKPLVAMQHFKSWRRRHYPCSGLDFGSSAWSPKCPDVDFSSMDFDSTLGYPGEGPPGRISWSHA